MILLESIRKFKDIALKKYLYLDSEKCTELLYFSEIY